MSADLCPKGIWTGWSERTCGRPVKRRGLCGVHAAAEEWIERSDRERRDATSTRAAKSAALVERFAHHGITAQVGYDGRLYLPGPSKMADALDAHHGGAQ